MLEIRSRGAAPAIAIQNSGGGISISVKSLVDVARPDFCPRCFWIKLRSIFDFRRLLFDSGK